MPAAKVDLLLRNREIKTFSILYFSASFTNNISEGNLLYSAGKKISVG